jgi:hypothetical protein
MVEYLADVLEANHNSVHFSPKNLLARADTSMKKQLLMALYLLI